jgi:hypothetical protein
MLFTSKSRQINSGNANQKIVSVPNMFAQVRPRRNPAISNHITTITPSDGHKMAWGKPTWTFLHILPEKINDANFGIVKDSIIRVIVTICNNLPCPTCSDHAKQYMKNVNWTSIRTRDDLRKMLYNFHNDVNKRKGYAEYPFDNVKSTYSIIDFKQVSHEFMGRFQRRVYAVNLIAQEMHRQGQIKIIRQWILDNFKYFQ